MKVVEEDVQKIPCPVTGQPKTMKKGKGGRKSAKSPDKSSKDSNKMNPKEISPEETENKLPVCDPLQSITETLNVTNSLKTMQLEKRKTEANEWKALKKIDYQRLETVLEEGQMNGEPSSKQNTETEKSVNDGEQMSWEGCHGRARKPWFYSLMSINEHPELLNGDELQPDRELESQEMQEQLMKRQQNGERGDKIECMEAHGEPAESVSKEFIDKYTQNKRNVILNGMMEILPIFSNDKFVCSRDAISIEECEEMETIEKTLPTTVKFIFDGKNSKENRTIESKPSHSLNSLKKNFRDRLTERFGDFKETLEGKFQWKILPENTIRKQSSHFINFLLVLTPFANEREKLLTEKRISECENERSICEENIPVESRTIQNGIQGLSLLYIIYGVILSTFGIMSVILGVAWKCYEPPCLLDYILEFFPFIHNRRTHFQIFFDKIFKIIASAFGALCKNKFFS